MASIENMQYNSPRNSILPLDPELGGILESNPALTRTVRSEQIARFRKAQEDSPLRLSNSALRRDGRLEFEEFSIAASDPDQEIEMLILRPTAQPGPHPGMCFFHGGGMIAGDNRTGLEPILEWIETFGIVIASVGYRLAPENPHPAPVGDCFAALCWMDRNRRELKLDEGPLMVAGSSAGGGLAAAVAILARDRAGPLLSTQILMCPMLDDRARFPSSNLDGGLVWDGASNRMAWDALLGRLSGGKEVPSYAAPSRETNLEGLPAAYLEVGSAETFRDETIDYAARLAQANVLTELHVWSGAFHGFDVIAPESALAKAARAMRADYLLRHLRRRTTT